MPSRVAIARHDDVGVAVPRALGDLDLGAVLRGKVVAVKPNDTWATAQDLSGVTHADTLDAVLSHLEPFGPRRLVVVGGAGAAETADVFRYAGLDEVVRRHGAEFVDLNRPPFTTAQLDYGPQREVVVNPFVDEIETLVSLAQLKLHQSATVTLAMKNVAMSFPAADYYGHPRASRRHPHHFFDDLQQFIVGMVKRFPIHVAIVVGHPAMIATGPLGGKPVEVGLALASRDAVAADAVGAYLLGFHPSAVRHIFEAGQIGLGETETDRMEIKGLPLVDAVRHFTLRAYGVELTYQHA